MAEFTLITLNFIKYLFNYFRLQKSTCFPRPHIKSVQWAQKVGCLKYVISNWCPFTALISWACRAAEIYINSHAGGRAVTRPYDFEINFVRNPISGLAAWIFDIFLNSFLRPFLKSKFMKKKFLETKKKKSFSRAINFVYLAQNFTDFFELRIPPF